MDSPQNVWQFLLICFEWIGDRATRILGIAQGTLAIVAAQDGLLTQKQVAAVLLITAILTFWRGQSVSSTVASAKAIVAQSNSPLANPPPESPK